MAIERQRASRRHPRGPDLRRHHALCEANFHQLVQLLPGIRQGVDQWAFSAGSPRESLNVRVNVVEHAPFTTTVALEQKVASVPAPAARIVVRLYHDVSMAEIVSWDHHRHWQPHYPYPNPKMYQPDEKLALNRFLSEWLGFCRSHGLSQGRCVTQFS